MVTYSLPSGAISYSDLHKLIQERTGAFGAFVEGFVNEAYLFCLSDGDVSIDCGAAKGWHTFDMAKKVGPNGLVHAFEALPENCAFLSERAKKWGYEHSVIVHEVALGASTGNTTFHRIVDDSGYSGIKLAWVAANAVYEQIVVPLRRLENEVPQEHWARVNFIKFDLEGGEFMALQGGAPNLLSVARPFIAFECGLAAAGKLYGYSEDEFFSFYEAKNYVLYDIFGFPFERQAYSAPHGNAPSEYIAVPAEKQGAGLDHVLRLRLTKYFES